MTNFSNSSNLTNNLQEYEVSNSFVLAGFLATREVIAIKPVCENLQIDFTWQFRKLQDDPYFSTLVQKSFAVGADGKKREMVCLDPISMQSWIIGIIPPDNMNIKLWEEYKRSLVITLLNMLRISMNEYVKLQENYKALQGELTLFQRETTELMKEEEEMEEISKSLTDRRKIYKDRKNRIMEKIASGQSSLSF